MKTQYMVMDFPFLIEAFTTRNCIEIQISSKPSYILTIWRSYQYQIATQHDDN